MIYIDPPYNTGSDSFVYPDRFKEKLDEYQKRAGVKDDEGNWIGDVPFQKNTKDNGHYHSNWISMMYPRLFLARQLLRDDGVIFVSIDDNEVHNLRLIMDEIFGEENFFSQIIIQSNKRGQTYKDIAKMHEYLLVYGRSEDCMLFELPKRAGDLPFEDEKGKFDLWELRNRNPKFGRHNRKNLYFPIYVSPNDLDSNGYSKISLVGNEVFKIEVNPQNSEGIDGCWRWSKNAILAEDCKSPFAVVVARQKNNGEWNIYEKSRKSTTKAKSIWDENGVISEQGTIELGEMDLKGIFDHPKPLALIKKTISIGMEKEDIVIDFFSGSGTTAQSVMELNRDDGGNRKFICVQLAESLDPENKDQKAGSDFCDSIGKPRNIAEICKERIRRAIKNLEKKSEGNLPDIGRSEPEDLGFKAFKLGESRIRDWECGSAEELPKQIEASVNNIKTGTTDETLLFELMLSGEAVLTAEVEKKVIGKDSWYSVDEGSLAICVSRKMSQSLLDSVLKAKPRKAIFLDESFNGNDKIKKNATLQFRDAGIEVKFV